MFYAIVETHVKIMKRYIRYPLIFRIVQSPLRTWIRYNGHDDWMIFYGIYCRWKLGTGRLPCFADSSRWPWLLYDSLDVGGWHWKCVLFVHVCSCLFYVALAIVMPLQWMAKALVIDLTPGRWCSANLRAYCWRGKAGVAVIFVHGWSGVPFLAWESLPDKSGRI